MSTWETYKELLEDPNRIIEYDIRTETFEEYDPISRCVIICRRPKDESNTSLADIAKAIGGI
jgi:hypothetical protein